MPNNYETFTAVDFVCDEAFLRHYVVPTAASTQFWADWRQQHPNRNADWLLACQLIEAVQAGVSEYARTYLSEADEAWLLTRILATNQQRQPVARVRPLWQNAWMYRGAVACSLLAAGYWLYSSQVSKPSVYQQQIAGLAQPPIEQTNQTTKWLPVQLSDGSTVQLAPHSQLRYPADYGQQNRIVFLQGEALFDVAKNARKPFFVYAGEVVTKVLGTKFVVRSFERDAKVTVIVQRGQVSVFNEPFVTDKPTANKTALGILLQPNQQAIFSRETETFTKALVPIPRRIDTGQNTPVRFVFTETPVTTVFDKLEEAYGIDIVYDAGLLKDCQLTASLTAEPLFQKLDVIVQSIDATYEVVEGRIIIMSNGCTPH